MLFDSNAFLLMFVDLEIITMKVSTILLSIEIKVHIYSITKRHHLKGPKQDLPLYRAGKNYKLALYHKEFHGTAVHTHFSL